MAQKTAWNGATLTESDINTYLMGEGGAWSTWSPTLTQSGTVTATTNTAAFGRWGRLIVAVFRLTVTGTGTASNAVTVSLPVTAARTNDYVGAGAIYDNSATLNYGANIALNSSTTVAFNAQANQSGPDVRLGVAQFTAALAVNDIVSGFVVYEAAS
jgi:hypothetical protein